MPKLLLITLSFLLAAPSFAQMVEVQDNNANPPPVGKERAQEYFQGRQGSKEAPAPSRRGAEGGTPRYLSLAIGSFFTSQTYGWGKYGEQDDKAKLNAALTYRLGEWVNSMDMALRVDYTNFQFRGGSARKLGIGVLVTFPDANSRFPLYFGAGVGPGFMIKQLDSESVLGLDYSLIGGVRFLDVIENVGFMVETGIKNHVSLLGAGQFNGVFINVGTVFAF